MNLKKRRTVRRVVFGIGLLGAVAAAVAFRTFFDRPGESALRLIPKDALVFGTADLSPSPTQALVFKKIDDALARNGLDKKIDGALTDIFARGPVAEELRPYSKRAAAFAMLTPEKSTEHLNLDENLVAFFSVSDPDAVAKIIRKHGKPLFWKGTRYFQLGSSGPGIMVVGDTVAVATKGNALHRVELVSQGNAPSILEREDFVAEREKIDGDANLMVFVAPEAFEVFAKDAPEEAKDFVQTYQWVAVGMAIRDGGIALSFNGAYDESKSTWLGPISDIVPIRQDLMAVLPKGAYSVNAFSQPSKYFESFELALKKNPEGRKMIREMETSIPKEAGLSLRQDILPAFQGNSILAVYPSESAKKLAGVDLLMIVDDQNGATAGAFAERFRESIEREIQEEADAEMFEVSTENGIKKYRLTAEAEDGLFESLDESLEGDEPFDRDALFKDKTITWAIMGNTVVVSSSAKLLDRALEGLKNRTNGLNTDELWAPSEKSLLPGSQTLAAFNIARLAEGFQNTVHINKMGDESKTVQEVADALKMLKEPFSVTGSMMNGRMRGNLFIPMDYDKLIDLIGKH